MKLGTYKTFSKTRLENRDTVPMWVTRIVWQLGRLIVKGGVREDNNLKKVESKHICSEAPESMIQVLELVTEKH